jgi:hypothetical protein
MYNGKPNFIYFKIIFDKMYLNDPQIKKDVSDCYYSEVLLSKHLYILVGWPKLNFSIQNTSGGEDLGVGFSSQRFFSGSNFKYKIPTV